MLKNKVVDSEEFFISFNVFENLIEDHMIILNKKDEYKDGQYPAID